MHEPSVPDPDAPPKPTAADVYEHPFLQTLMPGHKITRNKGWWRTGNSNRVATRDLLDLWAPT
eukprot:1391185-Rhodomonas_salina.1